MKMPPGFTIQAVRVNMSAEKGCFTELPDELILEIVKYLGPLEQAALQRANSRLTNPYSSTSSGSIVKIQVDGTTRENWWTFRVWYTGPLSNPRTIRDTKTRGVDESR